MPSKNRPGVVTLRISVLIATFFCLSAGAAFAQSPRHSTVAEPAANLPSQPVGPNDLISISVYDAPELSRTIRVGADGYFATPMLKRRLLANGLHPAELEASIAAALQE